MLFFQGDLPYWGTKKGKNPTAICNTYRLWRYNTDVSVSTSFLYTDCFGINRVVELGPDFGYQAYVCSSTTPTLSQFPSADGPFGTQAYFENQGCCGCPDPVEPEKPVDPETPEVECDETTSYNGGHSYPSRILIDLGTSAGVVTLTYDARNLPDKFIIMDPNAPPPSSGILLNTGYRGHSSFQPDICDFYSKKGLPCPACYNPIFPELGCEIIGGGEGSQSFFKTSSVRWVYLEVYAPIGQTVWDATVGCPVAP